MLVLSLLLINIFLYILIVLYCKLTCGINKCSKHLVGKVVIVTGGNAGIGYETARDLSARGARVILACRNETRGARARDQLISATGNQDVHFRHLDLASFKSVRAFAQDILDTETRLDILINNAGIIGSEYKKTEDGLLLDMQTNHFGPFLLTSLLLPLLKQSQPSRIVNVSSIASTFGKIDFDNLNVENGVYDESKVYSTTKLCNILMTVELAKRLKGTKVTAYSLHPGAVKTDILNVPSLRYLFIKYVLKPVLKSPWEGAQTSIYVAVSPEVSNLSGQYFSDCRIKKMPKKAVDVELARKLWEISEKVTNITNKKCIIK